MTEPMIKEAEAEVEEFTDELSDEALDREQGEGKGGRTLVCCQTHWCCGSTAGPER